MKNLLLIATGGTIASQDSGLGLAPEIGAGELLKYIPEAARQYILSSIQIFNIESSDILPKHWELIVKTIKENYGSFDGFVVVHGTDSLAYTSSALSYLIQNSRKPIVVTGAQYPIEFENTDGIRNLTDSCAAAADDSMHGVMVVFHGRVMLGNHVKKVMSKSFDAFQSVNFPDIAAIEEGRIKRLTELPKPQGDVKFIEKAADDVFLLKFYPGIKPEHFEFVADAFRGIVMEGYGVAGIPVAFMPLFEEWDKRGIVMAVSTQVMYEGSDLEVYTVGKAMVKKFDVIQGFDMTIEAVLTKVMYLLGQEEDVHMIKKHFYQPVQADLRENL